MSGFVWPQLGYSQLWMFIQIVLKRLGFVGDSSFPQAGAFEFCVSKPSLDSRSRREEFSLIYRSFGDQETLFFTPLRAWVNPIALFVWVKHAPSESTLTLCFAHSNSMAYRHALTWLKFYKLPTAQFQQDSALPFLGGLQ